MPARRKSSLRSDFFSLAQLRTGACAALRSLADNIKMCVMSSKLLCFWWICGVYISCRWNIFGWQPCRVANTTTWDTWFYFVERTIRSWTFTISYTNIFGVRGTHQYRFLVLLFFRMLRCNVWKETRRPLTYLYRPNFPLRVVNGLP